MLSGDGHSTISQDTTIVRDESLRNGDVKAHKRTASHIQRYDKLQPQEVKDVLLIFLFTVKYLNEEQLLKWWQNYNDTEVVNFFTVLEMSVHCFKYVGKRNITAVKTVENNVKTKSKKAHTLPARMNPSEISHEPTGTLVIHTTRENLITSGKFITLPKSLLELKVSRPHIRLHLMKCHNIL